MAFNLKDIDKAICPPGKTAIHLPDPATRGLYVQIARGGTKTFVYRRKAPGKKGTKVYRQKLIARVGEMSISVARQKADRYNADFAAGIDIFDDTAPADPTFRHLFESYMTKHAEKKCTTTQDMRKNFDRWFKDLADLSASKITPKQVDDLHSSMGQKAKYAANRAMQLGRAIYYRAIKSSLIKCENPFANISLFDEQPRNRFLSNAEVGKLYAYCSDIASMDDETRHLADFVRLDLLTGARKTALLSAEWSEIDLKAATWTIPASKAKNKQEQLIPLGLQELQILEDRRDYLDAMGVVSPFVFPGEGRTGHIVEIKRSWKTMTKRLNLEDATIHDLRRSLAAAMASQNVNVALIKAALNHKDMKTTLRAYAHTGKSAELEAKQLAHTAWLTAVKQSDGDSKADSEQA